MTIEFGPGEESISTQPEADSVETNIFDAIFDGATPTQVMDLFPNRISSDSSEGHIGQGGDDRDLLG